MSKLNMPDIALSLGKASFSLIPSVILVGEHLVVFNVEAEFAKSFFKNGTDLRVISVVALFL